MAERGNPKAGEGKDKGSVFECRWCKSKKWNLVEDYLKWYIFCGECGKVTVYLK